MSENRSIEKPKRSRTSKLLELLFWVGLAIVTAWLMIENIETILPGTEF